jgi:hypothetical protein
MLIERLRQAPTPAGEASRGRCSPDPLRGALVAEVLSDGLPSTAVDVSPAAHAARTDALRELGLDEAPDTYTLDVGYSFTAG